MKLYNVCDYVTERIDSQFLTTYNYISTENMLPNKEGITYANNIPKGNVIAYNKGDILISNIRPYFKKIWQANINGGCSSDVLCIRAKSTVSSKFLFYLLSQQSFFDYVMSGSKGCKMPRGDKQQIMQWDIELPTLEEQITIANILSSLDDKIELNRRINENLEQQAQALFKSWFVDFEPFKDGKFVDSELGMIPEGWKVGTLDEVGEIIGGGTPSKSEPLFYCDKGISWITPKDLSINQSKYISKGKIDITEIGYKNSSAKKIPAGSVLFSSRAPIGYIAIASNEVTTNQGFKSVIPQKAGTCFIYLFLKYNTEYIESQATGSTFKEVSGSLMKSQKLIIPTQYILDEFEYKLGPIFSMQYNLESENHRLIQIRDTLLPKLMSGELKLSEIETKLDE